MARYFIGKHRRAKAWGIDEDEPFRPYLEVSDFEPKDTGLIDQTGGPIMRMPNPMGFGRDEDW